MIMPFPLLLAVSSIASDDCHAIDREYVLARDVAALVPAFASVDGEFNLGYLPSSGAPRILKSADLERIAKNRGIELAGLADICFGCGSDQDRHARNA